MQLKKLAAVAVALVMTTGIGAAFPVDTGFDGIALTASAASDFVIKTDSDGLKFVSKYNGKGGDITIPKDVNYIGESAFEENDTITSVTFPAKCDFVDIDAFNSCPRLRTVVFEGNADMDQRAFCKCISLQSVTVNGSIKSGIGASAFQDCQSLTTVKIKGDKNNFWIGECVFMNCYSLTNINIPSKCTEIFGGAFLNCFSLTKLTIPEKTKINVKEGIGIAHFGYALLFPTEEDCLAFKEGRDDYNSNYYVAGAKTGYSIKYTRYPGSSYLFYYEAAQYTPKAITLIVTKDSPAEEWAKQNKVKYTYVTASSGSGSKSSSGSSSSSGDELAAPTGIKSSKTKNTITLTWNSISGADAYRVYIYDSSTGKYVKYKDVSGAKCTVSGLSSGTTYKFKVAALEEVNGKYKAGKASKPVSVKTQS